MKKAAKHIHKKYKETFTRTGDREPEDHHIAGVILLLSLIVILLSGVVYLLLQENEQKDKVIEELIIQKSSDYSSFRYSFEEFSRIAGTPITSAEELELYLYSEGFEEVIKKEGYVAGRKGSGCYNEAFIEGIVCRTVIIAYDSTVGEFVEVGIERKTEV